VLVPQPPRAFRSGRRVNDMRGRRPTRIALLVAALALAGGCASRADLERVRRDQQDLRARLADVQVSLDSVNRRLDTMRSSMDDKGGSSASVRALETRIAALETRINSTPPSPTADTGAVAAIPAPTEQRPPPVPNVPRTEAANIALRREDRAPAGSPNDPYRRGLQAYREGQADQAIQLFHDFLRSNPKSDLADNAQYWIGEAYYSKGDYNRAIIELNEVLLKYPQGDQVPGALLALATSFSNSGDPIDAKLILQKLVTDHPKSEEAEVGRQQLQKLSD
jgi:tol-pal system protein YbgF